MILCLVAIYVTIFVCIMYNIFVLFCIICGIHYFSIETKVDFFQNCAGLAGDQCVWGGQGTSHTCGGGCRPGG